MIRSLLAMALVASSLVQGSGCGACPAESDVGIPSPPRDVGAQQLERPPQPPTVSSAPLNPRAMTLETLTDSRLPVSVSFGPLGHRVAWLADTGTDRQRYVVDGEDGPPFLTTRGGIFSSAGQQFAYAGQAGPTSRSPIAGDWTVIVGKERYGPYEDVHGIRFADNGSVMWRAKLPAASASASSSARFAMVVDGVSDPQFSKLPSSGLLFGVSGELLAYRARSPVGWHVVQNGQPGPAFDQVGTPTRSSDGRTVAYVGRRGDELWLVAGARKVALAGQSVESIVVLDGGEVTVLLDRRVLWRDATGARPTRIAAKSITHLVHVRGTVGYVRVDGPEATVVVGDTTRKLPPSTTVSALRVSPDARRFVAFGRHGDRVSAFVDMESTWPASGSISNLRWSKDGRALAYVMSQTGGPAERHRPALQQFIVVDGETFGPFRSVQELSLSPTDSHFAFVAKPEGRPPELWVDGVRKRAFEAGAVVSFMRWTPAGRWIASLKDKQGQRLIWDGGASRNFDDIYSLKVDASSGVIGAGVRTGRELRWETMTLP